MSGATSSRGQGRRPGRGWPVTLAGLLAATLLLAACSGGDDPPTVTLPELDTTTTVDPRTSEPEQLGPEGDESANEPLPIAWITQVGGTGDDRLAAVTGDGASVVAGGSTTSFDAPSLGGTDNLVVRVDTGGSVVSAGQSGSGADDAVTGVSTNDLGVVACGTTAGALGAASGGSTDAFCATLDPADSLGPAIQLGGPDSEQVGGVAFAPGSSTGYLAGTESGILPGAQDPSGRGLGGGDALAVQLGQDGSPIWARQFGTPGAEAALAVAANADGDGILAGFTDGALEGPSDGGRDAWISRFDPTGNQRWLTQIGSTGSDEFTAVTTAGEARRGTEQFVAGGSTDGDADGDGIGASAGGTDGIAASFGTDGRLVWITQFGTPGEDRVSGIVADGSTIYLTGTTTGALGDLLPDGGPGGGSDGFVAALDAVSGTVRWVSRFGSPGDETMTGLTTTEDGLLVAVGSTTGQVSDTAPAGGVDAFVIAFPLASSGGGAASSV